MGERGAMREEFHSSGDKSALRGSGGNSASSSSERWVVSSVESIEGVNSGDENDVAGEVGIEVGDAVSADVGIGVVCAEITSETRSSMGEMKTTAIVACYRESDKQGISRRRYSHCGLTTKFGSNCSKSILVI